MVHRRHSVRPNNNQSLIKPEWDLRLDISESKRGLGKLERRVFIHS